MEKNRLTYEDKKIVERYGAQKALQKPEQTIFHNLNSFIKNANLIDIGVGAGRTAAFLIPMTKQYTGIDYSQQMIDHCKKIYVDQQNSFLCADARSMTQFSDESFDFVLFSFNGIDSVSYEDRQLILDEIYRILRKGGYFCFSSHNSRSIPSKYKIRIPKNPFNYSKELKRFSLIRKMNGERSKYSTQEYFNFFDGAEDFKFAPLYIKPELQLEQLAKMKFSNIEIYGLDSGKKISADELVNSKDAWLYYLCIK